MNLENLIKEAEKLSKKEHSELNDIYLSEVAAAAKAKDQPSYYKHFVNARKISLAKSFKRLGESIKNYKKSLSINSEAKK